MNQRTGRHRAVRWVGALTAAALVIVGGIVGGGGAWADSPGGGFNSGFRHAGGTSEPVEGGRLVVVVPLEESDQLPSLDPNVGGATGDADYVLVPMFDRLVHHDPETGLEVPGIAASWEISDDGLEYTFVLRDEAVFWDGSPVTAEDVKFTYDRAADEQYLPQNGLAVSLLTAYDRAEVVDEKTVKIILTEPQPEFLLGVVAFPQLGIVSRAAVEANGLDAFGENPMGAGPFKVHEWVRGSHLILVRNDLYTIGPEFTETAGGPPMLDAIEFRFIAEDSTRVAALDSGQANLLIGVPAFDEDRLGSDSQFELLPVPKNGQPGGLTVQTQRFPTDDIAVRQAIAYAVDREALNNAAFDGRFTPNDHLLEAMMQPWLNEEARAPGHDPEEARGILDEAGWVAGSDGIREKDGERLVVDAVCTENLTDAMTLIQAQLQEVGIEVNVLPGSDTEVDSIEVSTGEFNLIWSNPIGYTFQAPSFLHLFFHGGQIPPDGRFNRSRTDVPELNDVLARAISEQDPEARMQLYYESQVLALENVSFIPLVSGNRNVVVADGIHGLMSDIRGRVSIFTDVWMEPSAQERWNYSDG